MITNKFYKALFVFIAVCVGLFSGAYGVLALTLPYNEELEKGNEIYYSLNNGQTVNLTNDISTSSGDVSVHFLELGNKYTGDCTYIKVGENIDILIDCGSKSSSIGYVSNYLNNYVTDNILEYVIVTHAHQDHYAGFATSTKIDSIFDLFFCENIITFSQTTNDKPNTTMYKNFIRELSSAKANETTLSNKITASQCFESIGSNIFTLDSENNISLEILNSTYYTERSSNENNHSVCCMINQGDKNFLFTGDLEAEGEADLVTLNNLPKVELLKAGHHGSKTSSTNALLSEVLDVSNPAIVCVCCCAGSSEYTSTPSNQFPTKEFIDRISQYTTYVYVTTMCLDYKNNKYQSFNGNIVINFNGIDTSVLCSNNTTLLKDSNWFKTSRYDMCKDSMHASWK